ncbi:MAG: Uma2 family endonuclease [Chitinophagaceae bacterium]
MKAVEINKKFASDEEYFAFEEASELKHELINGNLYEMSGVSKYHNTISRIILILLTSLLKNKEWEIYYEGFKIKTPNGNYFYPDVCVCLPDAKKYFTDQPVLIVEVLSEKTRKFDLTDKFIQYREIKTLEYYLCVEPEQKAVVFYFKNNEGEWLAETFTKDKSIINLPKLNISFALKEIYNS